MRYILDVSGHDLKLIRASIVNFQRSLELSDQAEFDTLIDDLDDVFFKISRMKKEQLNNKIAGLEWQWFQQEISDKEYVVQFDDLTRRIRDLEG